MVYSTNVGHVVLNINTNEGIKIGEKETKVSLGKNGGPSLAMRGYTK